MSNAGKIVGLIVAAGYSRRMGRFKPLLPLGEKTVIENAVESLRQGGIKDIRVVTGYRAEQISSALANVDVRIINNPKYAAGMFSSILAGIESMESDIDGFLMLPGDNPLIRRRTVKAVLREYRRTGATVVYPVFGGERGHPPFISSKSFAAIRRSNGDGGLRMILDGFAAAEAEVAVADQGILMDLDTAEDYQKMTVYYERHPIPTGDECLAILDKYQGNENVVRHGRAVAALGYSLAVLLKRAGLKMDPVLVSAAALLHDLAKGKKHHARRGARMLKSIGFSCVADIIVTHMDFAFREDGAIDEAAIVFLADKLVCGEQRVTLWERFRPSMERFADQPEAVAAIVQRMQSAIDIQHKIFRILGIRSFDELHQRREGIL